ncbi:MAG: hypothetical protein V1645_05105 [archaeon]
MIEEGVQDLLDFIFSTGGVTTTALIKLALFVIVFFAIFKGTEKVFKNQKRAIPVLIAAIIAFTGIRLMPDEWIETMSGVYGLIIGFVVILLPYILISIACDLARIGRTIKWILVISAYGAIIYYLPAFGFLEFGSDAVDMIFRYAAENRPMAALIFLVILVILIYIRSKMGSRSFLGSVGRTGTGAMRGVGNSAMRGAGYLAGGVAAGGAAGAAAGKGWFQRRAQQQKARKEAYEQLRRERR